MHTAGAYTRFDQFGLGKYHVDIIIIYRGCFYFDFSVIINVKIGNLQLKCVITDS